MTDFFLTEIWYCKRRVLGDPIRRDIYDIRSLSDIYYYFHFNNMPFSIWLFVAAPLGTTSVILGN